MLKKYFKNRLDVFRVITLLIFLLIIFRLGELQIVQGEYYKQRSLTIRTRNIAVSAPRGNIVDEFGRIIAGNQLSYSVNIMKSDLPQSTINETVLSVINIIEQNGDTYKDEIPILVNPMRFTFEEDELNWKHKYNIPDNATAQEAFKKLTADFAIQEGINDTEAYAALKDLGVELPFDIKDYQYTFKTDETTWKKNNKFDVNITAEQAFDKLLGKYNISRTQYGDDKAKKILAIKYLLGQNIYKAYEPVEIAVNIKEQTRAQIEENKVLLPGVEIMEKPIRKYYDGDLACHILGYMGKIGEELSTLASKGYSPQDIVGKQGLEYSMEQYLKGTNGSKQIEVDVYGTLINTINETEPTPGDTVQLTIDSKVQKVAQESLYNTLQQIQKGDPSKNVKSYPNATSGAVVAIDVNTGRVLALASEPTYDPNIFAAGISNEDWQLLQPKSKDIYAPKPLLNSAISVTLPPGSSMKMVTATAGLENNKITPSEIIVDKGYYTAIPGVAPSCSIFKSTGIPHGPQNVALALKNSCNYFFFEVGRRIGGSMFEEYATKFGFGQKTGIDLPWESTGGVEGPVHKQQRYEGYLANYLTSSLKFKDENVINEIKGYISTYPSSTTIRKRLKELGISDASQINTVIRLVNDSKWQPGNVLNAAIGQGANDVTPLQMANYVATLVNGGTRYKPYLVEKVIGYDGTEKLVKKPEVVDKIDISQETIDAIKQGMYMVTNEAGGTARSAFVGSKVVVSGKTGTAQAGGNYDDHAWFVAFAPYDKPQIAIAILISQGGHGNYAAPIARAIAEQYLTPEVAQDNPIPVNDILP